jgi:hypothetical protein
MGQRTAAAASLAVLCLTTTGCLSSPKKLLAPLPPPTIRAGDESPPPAKAQEIVPVAAQLPASTEPTPPPTASAPPANETPLDALKRLIDAANTAYAPVESYIAQLRRREVVSGRIKPAETILFKFRRQPESIAFKWLNEESKGRELVYVVGRYDNKLHIRLAAGDMPFARAGMRMAFAPDSSLVRSASRHGVEDAGIGASITRLQRMVTTLEQTPERMASVKYTPELQRAEYARPLEAVEYDMPPGVDRALPEGGRRLMCFDPQTHFPVLVVTHDAQGREVEYYCYDRIQLNVGLDDADFDPDLLWGSEKSTKTKP